ncbi:MAG: NAD(P)-binding domain-containing protein [Bryobacteraceae bacterium]|jgi:thioredoxin reductase/pSer/pThr/pTyr-binding forkhead associated (FHA) protein
MLELNFTEGGQRGKAIRLTFEKAWFGRQSTCDFVLLGDEISRLHFCIERRGEDYVLVDNKSTNGTFVNSVRATVATLRPGDDISVGSNRMQVREVAVTDRIPFRFVAERKDVEGSVQLVEQETVLVGRKSICPIQLNDPAVAAVHAQLEHHADGVWITDESSDAGVYVNGQRVVNQQLRQGDVVTIRPFEISIWLSDEMCVLSIQDPTLEAQPLPENLPANYRSAVAPPPRADGGKAKPSTGISALPHWMRAKAPIWVPTSDILPNRFRSAMLVITLVAVLGWAAAAFAAKWNSEYSPGPLTEAHAAFGCESCHSGFARVPDSSCQACHAGKLATAIHQQKKVGCADCHTEHHGAKFDIARDVGSGCQAAGCHVTVHAAEQRLLARQGPPEPGLKVPPAVALAAHFEAGDAMHDKHANLKAACAACHTSGDPSLLDVNPKQPAIRTEELKVIRMRCLGCHGFGPEATLRERCYSCHLEHPTQKAEVLGVLRFPDSAGTHSKPAQSAPSGLLVFLGALAVVPLFVIVAAAGGLSFNQRRLRREVQQRLGSTPIPAAAAPVLTMAPAAPSAAAPSAAEPKPTDNQTPGGNLRPRIDLDLCVGCGTCVHVCPFNVLEIVNEKAIAARLGDCTGYAACAAECPTEAIVLVSGGAMQTVELPMYDANLETNVPGLYLAGEITGKALIKVAINQGKQVVESILKNRPQPGEHYDVIVVGAGPAGTSTALAAISEGLKVLVLEQGTQANTIRNYPRQKFVMAEPVMIPVYGPLWMEDSSKESLLERWQEIIASTGLVVHEEEKVIRVVQNSGHFVVHSTKGEYKGARVVMAIGKRGSPRKLGAPGEDSAKVAYNLMDADAYRGTAICIVGGGDSGIEAACGLARPDLENRVWLVHRTDAFAQAKPRNQKKIKKFMDEGRVTAFFESSLVEVRERSVVVKTPLGDQEIDNNFLFVMVGGESPKKFLNECGIEFSQRPLG